MKEIILKAIQDFAKDNVGTPPGIQRFARKTGINESSWRGIYWARWSDALIEAGFTPNEWNGKLETEFVFHKFIESCRHYLHIPTDAELKLFGRTRSNFPKPNSIRSHFGSKDAFIENLRIWIAGKEGFDDVAMMLGAKAKSEPSRAAPTEGHVYLIKSGAHYKIGRSDELERRVKEIRIALPEAASLVHTIRTDDPAGIEAYWHRRFADRRANGEWFKLTSADIAVFKRRKFQ